LLKKQTLNTSLISIGILIICSGVSLRVHERGVSGSALDEVWNGFWLTSVTLTSVGYGDIAPVTHIGRGVCMLSALIGVFLTSYVVLAVQNLTEIEDDYE
jgi:voltage-gated potassium channel